MRLSQKKTEKGSYNSDISIWLMNNFFLFFLRENLAIVFLPQSVRENFPRNFTWNQKVLRNVRCLYTPDSNPCRPQKIRSKRVPSHTNFPTIQNFRIKVTTTRGDSPGSRICRSNYVWTSCFSLIYFFCSNSIPNNFFEFCGNSHLFEKRELEFF